MGEAPPLTVRDCGSTSPSWCDISHHCQLSGFRVRMVFIISWLKRFFLKKKEESDIYEPGTQTFWLPKAGTIWCWATSWANFFLLAAIKLRGAYYLKKTIYILLVDATVRSTQSLVWVVISGHSNSTILWFLIFKCCYEQRQHPIVKIIKITYNQTTHYLSS